MSYFPYFSGNDLERLFRKRVKKLSSDRNNILPVWARENADNFFGRRKFVICGSVLQPEMRILARNANVIAIVDDFLAHDKEKIFGLPVINTAGWIELVRADRSIVSCILTPGGRATQHFTRRCMIWDFAFLTPLQLLYVMRLNKIDTAGEVGRFLSMGFELFEHFLENADKLMELGKIFDDEYSRITWFSMIMYHMTLNPFYMEGCAIGTGRDRFGLNSFEAYSHFFEFSDQEVYVDGGAYTGDTITGFLKAVNGKFRHIYAFEPSTANSQLIISSLKDLQGQYLDSFMGKFSIISKGLWDCEDMLHFRPDTVINFLDFGRIVDTPAAYFVEPNKSGPLNLMQPLENERMMKVPVTTIDESTNRDASFIKLEVEGAELRSLRGAVKTLERSRPKMAISMYHKIEDYITLTEFILNTGLNYRLGFRQHLPSVPCETVLYCYH